MIRHSAERRRDVRRPRLSRLPTSRRQFKRCRLRLPTINHLSRLPPSEAPNNQPSVQAPPSEAPYNQPSIQASEGKRGFVIPPTVSFNSTPTPAVGPAAPLATPPAVTPPSAAPTYAPTSPSQYHSPPFAKPKEEPLDWFTIFWAIVSVPFLIIIGLFSAVKGLIGFARRHPFLSMFVGWMAVNSASKRAENLRGD